jgi:hypothetical protein
MTEATGGRRYYNSQWAQEDVETLYNLLNNNNLHFEAVSAFHVLRLTRVIIFCYYLLEFVLILLFLFGGDIQVFMKTL